MTTETPDQKPEIVAETEDYQVAYLEGSKDEGISAVAKACASKVLERLVSIRPHSNVVVITDQMQAAIACNDVKEILRLSKQLEALQKEEESQLAKLVEMSDQFRFDELLSAYPNETKALAYELAVLVMSAAQEESQKTKKRDRSGGRRTRSSGKTYIVHRGEKSIEIVPNVGAPASPGQERDVFTFLGFEVSSDGKMVTPAVFTDKSGVETTAKSKKAIIEDMLAGGSYWSSRGFTISEKSAEKPEDDPQST